MAEEGVHATNMDSQTAAAVYEALGRIIVAMIEKESDQELKKTEGITNAIKEIGSALMTVQAHN